MESGDKYSEVVPTFFPAPVMSKQLRSRKKVKTGGAGNDVSTAPDAASSIDFTLFGALPLA
jgi:hypothetical protein